MKKLLEFCCAKINDGRISQMTIGGRISVLLLRDSPTQLGLRQFVYLFGQVCLIRTLIFTVSSKIAKNLYPDVHAFEKLNK
jgi:hypothetical protein